MQEQAQKTESRTRFLETQISNRESEIAVLRKELESKTDYVEELRATVEDDNVRLESMMQAVKEASQIIEKVKNQNHLLARRCNRARTLFPLLFLAGTGIGGGVQWFVGSKHAVPEEIVTLAEPTVQLAAKTPAPVKSLQITPDGPVSRTEWLSTLSLVRTTLFPGDEAAPWDISPEWESSAQPVTITRSQFRDLVSKTSVPMAPGHEGEGILLYELDKEDFDADTLSNTLSANKISSAQLCNPWEIETLSAKRLTIILSSNHANLDCLKRIISSPWAKHSWEEFTIISMTEQPKLLAGSFAEKKFINLQEWNPTWLDSSLVGNEAINPQERAQRLGKLARVLTRISDVRIQVPTAIAEIKTNNGSLVLPNRDGTEANVSLGNFAFIARSVPTGPLKATRISIQTGKLYGHTVVQNIAPSSRAVIINGAEQ